ncbi:UNVERIFIED_CONTAM: hypothetical protein K2H54_001004 [Gekko kuhli]
MERQSAAVAVLQEGQKMGLGPALPEVPCQPAMPARQALDQPPAMAPEALCPCSAAGRGPLDHPPPSYPGCWPRREACCPGWCPCRHSGLACGCCASPPGGHGDAAAGPGNSVPGQGAGRTQRGTGQRDEGRGGYSCWPDILPPRPTIQPCGGAGGELRALERKKKQEVRLYPNSLSFKTN